MEVVPAINCLDFECVRERLKIARDIGARWVQFDVADGKFALPATWSEPERLRSLGMDLTSLPQVGFPKIEAHLMVEDAWRYVRDWGEAADRMIVHLEVLSGRDFEISRFKDLRADFGLALKIETPTEDIFPYLEDVQFVQFLAVSPGPSGQEFDRRVLEKIKVLRERDPYVIVEVDGGVNLEAAQELKGAGVDVLVVGSYIFDSGDPKGAFRGLSVV